MDAVGLGLVGTLHAQGEMGLALAVDLGVEHLVLEVGGGLRLEVDVRAGGFDGRLWQDERLADPEHPSLEMVRLLDLVDGIARIAGVPARGDRPERVVRLDDVDPLRPVRGRRPDEPCPDECGDGDRSPRSAPTAIGKKARYAAMTDTDIHGRQISAPM